MKMPYIDMHCDTLMMAFLCQKKAIGRLEKAMTDLERLEKGECMAQFFAVFMPPLSYREKYGNALPNDETYIRILHSALMNTILEYPDRIALARTLEELKQNQAAKKVSAVLTMEDGRPVLGSMENLKRYYDMGVRVLGLTWNDPNCFGAPNSQDPAVMAQGLTDFGKQAVGYMNELGMGIDVSHLSDGGFWDVVELTKKPFFATHSNCRSLNPHPRSMTDEMIRALAENGGVMGINFGPKFLTENLENNDSRADMIAAQLRHMIQVGGLETAAIGSDFDGINGNLEIGSADKMPELFAALERNGFTANEIEHIAYKNVQRVLGDVL